MMKRVKKIAMGCCAFVLLGAMQVHGANHTVQSGESYWKISQKYNVALEQLLRANNASGNSVLYVGQNVIVPDGANFFYHTVRSGESAYLISKAYGVSLQSFLDLNNMTGNPVILIGQKVKVPIGGNQSTNPVGGNGEVKNTAPYVTYITHTVKSGDNYWNLSEKYGIPYSELLSVNKASASSTLTIGQRITVPVHHVPILSTPSSKNGENLDWWKQAQYVVPIGATFKVTDYYTGKTFMAKRTTGANHSDTETVSAADTAVYKSLFGGNYTWNSRPVIIEYKGRKIAASMSGMPHAGNENAPAGVYTTWRSGDYGAGTNFDYVKGNNMNGHFDIHFLNSTKHKDGTIDATHQKNVKIAAGIQ